LCDILIIESKYAENVNVFSSEVKMVTKYFIFDSIVILLFIIFITYRVIVKMSKLRATEASDKLKDNDNL
jgi:hypothetical protein